jgi:hypothetical protein
VYVVFVDEKQIFTGVITGDLCDKADHKAMNMGPGSSVTTQPRARLKYELRQ